jgi:hypothetical protein
MAPALQLGASEVAKETGSAEHYDAHFRLLLAY